MHSQSDEGTFTDAAPQGQCILFRLPIEVRWAVYKYLFSEVEVARPGYLKNLDERDLKDTSLELSTDVRSVGRRAPYWFRPGCTTTERTIISTELLRTCKRAYNEASMLPISFKTHKCDQNYRRRGLDIYLKQFTIQRQLNQIRSIHIYTQEHTLDDKDVPLRKPLKTVASSLEHLTITLRNCQRSTCPSVISGPLQLNPYRLGSADIQSMREDMELMSNGGNLLMPKSGWAATFAHLPNLKTLTMQFEHHEGFKDDLEKLAMWAQMWRFPLSEDYVLVSNSAQQETWRGLLIHDTKDCRICGLPKPDRTRASISCEGCQWRRRGKGPLMITWKVSWVKTATTQFEDMSVKPRRVKGPGALSRELQGLGVSAISTSRPFDSVWSGHYGPGGWWDDDVVDMVE